MHHARGKGGEILKKLGLYLISLTGQLLTHALVNGYDWEP